LIYDNNDLDHLYAGEPNSVEFGELRRIADRSRTGRGPKDRMAERIVSEWDAGSADRKATADKVYEAQPGTQGYAKLEKLAEQGDKRAISVVAGWVQGVRTKQDPTGLNPAARGAALPYTGPVINGVPAPAIQPTEQPVTPELRAAIAGVYSIPEEYQEFLSADTEQGLREQGARLQEMITGQSQPTTPPAPWFPHPARVPGHGVDFQTPDTSVEAGMKLYRERKQQ